MDDNKQKGFTGFYNQRPIGLRFSRGIRKFIIAAVTPAKYQNPPDPSKQPSKNPPWASYAVLCLGILIVVVSLLQTLLKK